MAEFKYRPDIDGLRAVAVLLVVFYHAGRGFSGGFIGVDVFFVISGYLITGLILKEQDADRFQLVDFWVRRVRRILPAAMCVVLVTLVAGAFLLFPSDYQDLAKSAIAQQFMLSNVYFWRESGYFAVAAESKPLLHTWSLALEEQFYLGFPLLLYLLGRNRRSLLLGTLIGLTLATFGLCLIGMRSSQSATFYLLPTRAWELLAGSLLAFAPRPVGWDRRVLEGMSFFGLMLILACGWLYSPDTPFPGWAALIPCAGTAALIYANTGELTWCGRLLAQPSAVFVGLLSYSLYLWHWPLLAFAHYWHGSEVPLAWTVLLMAAAFGLAYLSWRFIETPLRKRDATDGATWKPFVVAASAAVFLVSAALAVLATEGISARFSTEELRLTQRPALPRKYIGATADVDRNELPLIGAVGESEGIDFLVWGDSHALPLAPMLDELARRHGLVGAVASRSSTIPLVGVWRPAIATEPDRWGPAVIKYVRRNDIPHVILVSHWAANIEGRPNGRKDTLIRDAHAVATTPAEAKAAFERALKRTVALIRESGAEVYVVAQAPQQSADPFVWLRHAVVARRSIPSGVSRRDHFDRQANVMDVLSDTPDVRLIDPAETCFAGRHRSQIADKSGSYYCDDDHLSPHGARRLLTPLFSPLFTRLASRKPSMRMVADPRKSFRR